MGMQTPLWLSLGIGSGRPGPLTPGPGRPVGLEARARPDNVAGPGRVPGLATKNQARPVWRAGHSCRRAKTDMGTEKGEGERRAESGEGEGWPAALPQSIGPSPSVAHRHRLRATVHLCLFPVALISIALRSATTKVKSLSFAVVRWYFCPPPPLVFLCAAAVGISLRRCCRLLLSCRRRLLRCRRRRLLRRRRRCLLRRRRHCCSTVAGYCSSPSPWVISGVQQSPRVSHHRLGIAPKTDVAIDAGIAPKSENLPVQVTPIRLTKDNYLSWSAALEIGITSRGRLPYITGDKPAPSKTDPQWANWALEDSQVKVWIISSVSADIQPLILRKPTSFEM
ncbi:hypothetical protein EJ110_NYTH30630 [Nymphaea thermarum]|nr:hypothetical protein EJ110_NYTH30630 [Nymphaea thermarum]